MVFCGFGVWRPGVAGCCDASWLSETTSKISATSPLPRIDEPDMPRRLRNMRPERVLSRLLAVLEAHADALQAGAIVTVTEAHTRVRHLPVQSDRSTGA